MSATPVTPDLDEARASLIRESLASLAPDERHALDLVAVPHWIPAPAVLLRLRDELLAPLPALLARSFVRVTDGGSLTVHPAVREAILANLGQEAASQISQRLVPVFDAEGSPEARIEALYHRLAAEPEEAARQMFRTAVTWRNEPYFAHQLVRRLVQVWREFDQRWKLHAIARSYFLLADLLGHPRPPREELALLRQLDMSSTDGFFAAYVKLRRGLALTVLNKATEAESALRNAGLQFQQLGMHADAAQALRGLGRLLTKIDRFREATAAYDKALELSRDLDLPVASAQALQGLAEIDAFRGRLGRSTKQFEEAIAIQSANSGRTAEANSRISFSQVLTLRGDLAAARQHLLLAGEAYDSVGQKLGKANCLKGLAEVSLEEGKLDEAEADLRSAREIFELLQMPTGLAACTQIEGHISMLRGDLGGAVAAFESALAAHRHSRDHYGVGASLRDLGAAMWLAGRSHDSSRLFHRSAKEFRTLGARLEAALSAALARTSVGEAPPPGHIRELAEAGVEIPRSFRPIWSAAGHLADAR